MLTGLSCEFLVDSLEGGTLHMRMKIAAGAVGQKGSLVMAITVTNERAKSCSVS
jgi:hypothetical protein